MEFFILTTEYCIIPIILWAGIFVIKVIESFSRSGHNKEKIYESGYEFILIESLCYFTVLLRVKFDACHQFAGINYLSAFSGVCFGGLLLYFIFGVYNNGSLKFKRVGAYRFIFYIFFWSLASRMIILYIFAEHKKLHTITIQNGIIYSTIILLLLYLIFHFIYKPIIEIYFITWDRAMSEKSNLLENGQYSKVRRISKRLFKIRFLPKNESNKIAYAESVKSYVEASLKDNKIKYWKRGKTKLLRLLNKKHFKSSYNKDVFYKLLSMLYCKLGDFSSAKETIAKNVSEYKQKRLLSLLENKECDNLLYE